MSTEAMRCGELIKRIYDIFETRANKGLQALDITLSQIKVLAYLRLSPDGSATLKELEKHLGSSQATVAGIVMRLEKKGFIEGYIDADDRRIKHVRLSKSGSELCNKCKSAVDRGEDQLLKTLEPSEQKELQRLLQKVYSHMRQESC